MDSLDRDLELGALRQPLFDSNDVVKMEDERRKQVEKLGGYEKKGRIRLWGKFSKRQEGVSE